MNVICLVPSITETLLACGVNVVGRTRFCLYPKKQVANIATVGGTKDINWQRCEKLKPDLVIFDREENRKEMADSCPFDWIDLHICSLQDISKELLRLATILNNRALKDIASRWQVVNNTNTNIALENIPGMIEWWNKPSTQNNFVYLIWRDPWMAIGEDTFIQAMLDKVGLQSSRLRFDDKYPTVDLKTFDRDDTVLLFSSEPFPFARQKAELAKLGYACGLIDGEHYSWYGIRSLKFLESLNNPIA